MQNSCKITAKSTEFQYTFSNTSCGSCNQQHLLNITKRHQHLQNHWTLRESAKIFKDLQRITTFWEILLSIFMENIFHCLTWWEFNLSGKVPDIRRIARFVRVHNALDLLLHRLIFITVNSRRIRFGSDKELCVDFVRQSKIPITMWLRANIIFRQLRHRKVHCELQSDWNLQVTEGVREWTVQREVSYNSTWWSFSFQVNSNIFQKVENVQGFKRRT